MDGLVTGELARAYLESDVVDDWRLVAIVVVGSSGERAQTRRGGLDWTTVVNTEPAWAAQPRVPPFRIRTLCKPFLLS